VLGEAEVLFGPQLTGYKAIAAERSGAG